MPTESTPDDSPSRLPSRRVLVLWAGLTAYVAASAFVAVFPSDVPIPGAFLGVPVALTVVVAAGALLLARDAARPLLVLAVVPLFALAAFDVYKACPAVGCVAPPGYEPWRNLKFFLRWSLTGPALGVSSEPYQCAAACPHRIELVPAALGYWAAWRGVDGRA
ncbi:MAG: hypothetical protein ABEJ22_09560 [Haloferacaceae archaeon]